MDKIGEMLTVILGHVGKMCGKPTVKLCFKFQGKKDRILKMAPSKEEKEKEKDKLEKEKMEKEKK